MRRWLVLVLLVSTVSAQPQHRACEEPFSGPDFSAVVPGEVLLADVGYGIVAIGDGQWSWQDGRLPHAGPEGYATPGDMGEGFAIQRAGHADCACKTAVYLYDEDGEVLREWPAGSHVYDMGGRYAVAHIDAVSLVAPNGSVQDIAMPEWDDVYAGGSWDVQRVDERLLIANGALQAAWIAPATGEVVVVALRDDAATAGPQIHMAGDTAILTAGNWAGSLTDTTFVDFETPAAGAYHGIAWGDRYVIAGDGAATVHGADGQLLSSVPLQGIVGHGVSGDTAYLGLLEGKCAHALLRFFDGIEATPPGMFDDPYAGGAFAWVPWPYEEADPGNASDDAVDTTDGLAQDSGAAGAGAAPGDADGTATGHGAETGPAAGGGVSTPWPAWSALLLLALAKRRRTAPAF